MRALTVRPPYAQLIALEMKRRETRSNPPPEEMLGRQIAIHAGKSVVGNEKLWGAIEKAHEGTFDKEIYTRDAGSIVATARIANAAVVVDRSGEGIMVSAMKETLTEVAPGHKALAVRHIMDYESFGNYHVDNWVWFLTEIEPLMNAVPSRGQLGLWNLPRCERDKTCDVHRILIQGCSACHQPGFRGSLPVCLRHQLQRDECEADALPDN